MLYIDTEFNGHGGQLISLAIVVNDPAASSFYGVWPLPAQVHPWVAEHVIPKLGRAPEDPAVLRLRLRFFLERYQGEPIFADWPDDFVHLLQAMRGDSFDESWIVPCSMQLIRSGSFEPDNPHNALSDAKALMKWHRESIWRDPLAG